MRVAIVGNAQYPDLEGVIRRIEAAAARLDLELAFEPALARGDRPSVRLEDIGPETDLLLTLGGDGTLLRGAQIAGPRRIPILGCDLGRLGFLTLVPRDELEVALAEVAAGDWKMEERLALHISVRPRGGEEAEGRAFYALNDAVIHKSGFARLIGLRVFADDDEVGHYSADGIILATATGSTAYSLSAGGPIVAPTMDGIVATPISPHTLAVRPVVFPGSTRITVELLSGKDDLQLTVDGQHGRRLEIGDRVDILRSETPVRLVCLPDYAFFTVLRRKLNWGDVRRPADATHASGAGPGPRPG